MTDAVRENARLPAVLASRRYVHRDDLRSTEQGDQRDRERTLMHVSTRVLACLYAGLDAAGDSDGQFSEASCLLDGNAAGQAAAVVRGKGARSPSRPPSRLTVIWGLISFALILLGPVPLMIAPADAVARRVAISLLLAGSSLLVARGAVLITRAVLMHRSARHSGQPPDGSGQPD